MIHFDDRTKPEDPQGSSKFVLHSTEGSAKIDYLVFDFTVYLLGLRLRSVRQSSLQSLICSTLKIDMLILWTEHMHKIHPMVSIPKPMIYPGLQSVPGVTPLARREVILDALKNLNIYTEDTYF